MAIAYSQREVGVANYKKELRRKIELGQFDVDEVSFLLCFCVSVGRSIILLTKLFDLVIFTR